MSGHSRSTNDYSPTKTGSREYNEAINGRREMLNVLASSPQQKLSKKDYERLRRMGSADKEASARSRHALKQMMKEQSHVSTQ